MHTKMATCGFGIATCQRHSTAVGETRVDGLLMRWERRRHNELVDVDGLSYGVHVGGPNNIIENGRTTDSSELAMACRQPLLLDGH